MHSGDYAPPHMGYMLDDVIGIVLQTAPIAADKPSFTMSIKRCRREARDNEECFHASPLIGAMRPILVEPVGIEPTTPCLQSRCSPS